MIDRMTRKERREREAQLRKNVPNPGAVESGLRLAKYYWLPTSTRWPGPSHVKEIRSALVNPVAETVGQSLLLALRESPLLMAVLFLAFFTAEAWQFFARLSVAEYWGVIGGILLLALLAFVLGLRRPWVATYRMYEDDLPGFDGEFLRRTTKEFPEEKTLASTGLTEAEGRVVVPRTSRWVVGAIEAVRLFFLGIVVGAAIAAFFTALGAIGVDRDLTSAWTTLQSGKRYEPSSFDPPLIGSIPGVTDVLARLSVALGAIAALNFAVRIVTDEEARRETVDERFALYGSAIRTWARLYHGRLPETGT
jgi:hypothetical protein